MKPVYSTKNKISLGKIFFTIIGLSFLIIVGYSFINNYLTNRQVNEEITKLEENITYLEEQSIEYKELIKYFDSQAYAEQKARTELGMQKAGEEVVLISNDNTSVGFNNDNADNSSITIDSNPKKWFRYLFIK